MTEWDVLASGQMGSAGGAGPGQTGVGGPGPGADGYSGRGTSAVGVPPGGGPGPGALIGLR